MTGMNDRSLFWKISAKFSYKPPSDFASMKLLGTHHIASWTSVRSPCIACCRRIVFARSGKLPSHIRTNC